MPPKKQYAGWCSTERNSPPNIHTKNGNKENKNTNEIKNNTDKNARRSNFFMVILF